MSTGEIALFALNASRDFGERVSVHLGIPLSAHEEREFEDGEHKARPLVNVRGKDVFVIQSLYSDARQSVNDKLCRLLFFIGCLKDAAAARVTAVVPYLGYSRKDRKTQARDPVTTCYVARLFEAVGTDRVLTLDVHNLAAYQNAFRCGADHLEAKKLFVEYFSPLVRDDAVAVVSPDVGGIKRAEQFRRALSETLGKEISTAFMEKYRAKGIVTGEAIIGDVKGREVIIIDDLISTATTMARAARTCHALGAQKVFVVASHGVFTGAASQALAEQALEKIVITDTIPPFRLAPDLIRDKLVILDATALFAQAVQRIHSGGSIVELLEI